MPKFKVSKPLFDQMVRAVNAANAAAVAGVDAVNNAAFMALVADALAAAQAFRMREVDIQNWQTIGFNQQVYTGAAGGVLVREKVSVEFDYWDEKGHIQHYTLM